MDLQRQKFKTDFAGRPLEIEISRLAEQATAAVLGRYGETSVLATVVITDEEKKGDYFPLMVDYEERFYAVGKILGSRFMRREGRASEDAVLSGRLIDRTIRPLFDHRMRNQVQVVITILSLDEENDPDFISMLAASVALGISRIPWNGPVAGVKIGKFFESPDFVTNPTESALKAKPWEMITFVSGTDEKINMIELEGKEVSEKNAIRAMEHAGNEIKRLVTWQKEIISKIGAKKTTYSFKEYSESLETKVKKMTAGKLENAIYIKDKMERAAALGSLKGEVMSALKEEKLSEKELAAAEYFYEESIDEAVHRNIIEKEKRPDGRRLDEVRELHAEVGLFPRIHGSAIFVRGNTQALVITTLAPPNAEQLVETMEFSGKKRFLLHYNFPGYSVGEISSFRGPGRREIGHGNLAAKALRNLIPSAEEFPYTIRLVSEILSSNGSSSMATVCGGTLSLMDAGVPLKKPAAGIAMGLMTDDTTGKYKILTDIQGPEDHYGDMDLKVAGTDSGVTAIQMDVKIHGVTPKLLGEALADAKKARLHILATMLKTLPEARRELSPYAPVILRTKIDPSRIGEVIGPGGKTINGIIARTGALTIDIEEDGNVFVAGSDKTKAEAALNEVKAIVREFKIGEIIEGPVVKIMEFGAIVELGPHHDGMIHVSELKEGFVKRVEDVVRVGDRVKAKIVKVDPVSGKIGLSLKNVN